MFFGNRSKAVDLVRKFLLDKDFLEIETPALFKSTPEGSREFLVPTRMYVLLFSHIVLLTRLCQSWKVLCIDTKSTTIQTTPHGRRLGALFSGVCGVMCDAVSCSVWCVVWWVVCGVWCLMSCVWCAVCCGALDGVVWYSNAIVRGFAVMCSFSSGCTLFSWRGWQERPPTRVYSGNNPTHYTPFFHHSNSTSFPHHFTAPIMSNYQIVIYWIQIDLEMSFINADDIMGLIEGLLHTLWKNILSITKSCVLLFIWIKVLINRMLNEARNWHSTSI